MKTLNYFLLLVLVLMIIAAGCGPNHKGYHTVMSLPYEANKGYFIKQCKEDSIVSKCWLNSSCFDQKNLHYVPFYCGNSKRRFCSPASTNGFKDSFYIYVPIYSESQNIRKRIIRENGIDTEVEMGESDPMPHRGSFGCNYFLLSGEASVAAQPSPSDLDINMIARVNKGCSLDYFTIRDVRYLNLVFIPHELENDTIIQYFNIDFPISIPDYNKLDSLIRVEKVVIGGINNNDTTLMNIYKGNSEIKLFTIKAFSTPEIQYFNPNIKPYEIKN